MRPVQHLNFKRNMKIILIFFNYTDVIKSIKYLTIIFQQYFYMHSELVILLNKTITLTSNIDISINYTTVIK